MSTNQEKAVARHTQEVTGASYMACLAAARSSRLRVPDGPDFIARWKTLAVQDAKARALVAKPKTHPRAATLEDFAIGAGMPPGPEPYSREWREQWKKVVAEKHGEAAAGMAESSVLADEQRRDWAQRQSCGVEGELKPLPKRRKP